MIIFLHNAKCSKSREWLKTMSNSGRNYTLRAYMKGPLSFDELEDLRDKLWIKAIEFTRINEPEYIKSYVKTSKINGKTYCLWWE